MKIIIFFIGEKYWKMLLLALVDSAMANFVEQLNVENKKILLLKPGHPRPTFRNDWKIKEV